MRHLLLKADWYDAKECRTLRDFEDAVVAKTGASVSSHPRIDSGGYLTRKFAQGTRLAPLRRFIPKRYFTYDADVLWVPLMGPESFELDLFEGWDRLSGRKILYLLDTFPYQFPLIKEISARYRWDLLITSFGEAVEPLNKITGKKWHHVPQGVSLNRFYPRQEGPGKSPPIFISSHGRRLAAYHEAIKEWCGGRGYLYDYSVTGVDAPLADRIGSSLFNICWPVELTNPERARGLSPITCRWFEAAASGAAIIGRPPKEEGFERFFGEGAVCLAPERIEGLPRWLDALEERSGELRNKALERLSKHKYQWSWENRVDAIINLLK